MGKKPDFQVAEDSIHIFLNFDKVYQTKEKKKAIAKIRQLMKNIPKEFEKDFQELFYYLQENLK